MVSCLFRIQKHGREFVDFVFKENCIDNFLTISFAVQCMTWVWVWVSVLVVIVNVVPP